MTPEQQRIAIAKACGWTGSHPNCKHPFDDTFWINFPDYLSDLNAMHKGLKSQDAEFNQTFAFKLDHSAMSKRVHPHQLTAQDWADCFIWVLTSKREGGNSTP
jgi:hypothetical protein